MTKKFNIAIFASGSGTNAEEIIKYFQHHDSIEVTLLVSNNAEAYALERAKKFHISSKAFTRQEFRDTSVLLEWLRDKSVTHIVLAGFLWLIPDYLLKAFPHRIINIHPALLPRHGGKGMYGMKVHERVRELNELETGITIHEVNENYDEGRILFQAACPVNPNDSPDQIARNVHRLEYKHYPEVIENWILQN
jgi:phosphoribosylglycinamide formyltransferase-1